MRNPLLLTSLRLRILPPPTSSAVKVDKDTDYAKLRVKALKTILRERGVKCEGCLEKSDFIKRAKETEHLEL